MTPLISEAETARLDEGQAVDKKLIEDFRCSFCLSFINDPVMCSKCENVFCLECQQSYYSKPSNILCSYCRQEISKQEDRFKPLNKKLRKKMKQLKFQCKGCPSILTPNKRGAGQGMHEDSCEIEVKYRCTCGHVFCARYS